MKSPPPSSSPPPSLPWASGWDDEAPPPSSRPPRRRPPPSSRAQTPTKTTTLCPPTGQPKAGRRSRGKAARTRKHPSSKVSPLESVRPSRRPLSRAGPGCFRPSSSPLTGCQKPTASASGWDDEAPGGRPPPLSLSWAQTLPPPLCPSTGQSRAGSRSRGKAAHTPKQIFTKVSPLGSAALCSWTSRLIL